MAEKCKPLSPSRERGFTLLEIIIVLGLMGGIASAILPNLRLTVDSQMSTAIRSISSQVRGAYDNALFTGRIQRLVFNLPKGEFWTEEAPSDFDGRPPLFQSDSTRASLKESNRKAYIEQLKEKEKNQAKRPSILSTDNNPIYYTIRSIPIAQKSVLRDISWSEVKDPTISKQTFPSGVVISKFLSGLNSSPIEYSSYSSNTDPAKEGPFAYIYFLPDGSTTPTSIQLGTKDKNNQISEYDLKFTLNLNTLTGQVQLLEGFQDANFKLPKK